MITVFTAKKIITMNPSWPDGTAIAVREGLILEVGTLDTLAPWLAGKKLGVDYEIDDQFDSELICTAEIFEALKASFVVFDKCIFKPSILLLYGV